MSATILRKTKWLKEENDSKGEGKMIMKYRLGWSRSQASWEVMELARVQWLVHVFELMVVETENGTENGK